MEGQCLAVLSSWQNFSLLSTIPGFVPFPRLPGAFPFMDSSSGYAAISQSAQLTISLIRVICHFPKGFLVFKSMPQDPLLNTKHKCILSLSLGHVSRMLGICLYSSQVFYTQYAIQGSNCTWNCYSSSYVFPITIQGRALVSSLLHSEILSLMTLKLDIPCFG
jgi:hypothetical protein